MGFSTSHVTDRNLWAQICYVQVLEGMDPDATRGNADVHMSVMLAQSINDLSFSPQFKPNICWPHCRSGSQACRKQDMTIMGFQLLHMRGIHEKVNNCELHGTRGYRVLVCVQYHNSSPDRDHMCLRMDQCCI